MLHHWGLKAEIISSDCALEKCLCNQHISLHQFRILWNKTNCNMKFPMAEKWANLKTLSHGSIKSAAKRDQCMCEGFHSCEPSDHLKILFVFVQSVLRDVRTGMEIFLRSWKWLSVFAVLSGDFIQACKKIIHFCTFFSLKSVYLHFILYKERHTRALLSLAHSVYMWRQQVCVQAPP